jgi:hypothetical protein
MKKTTKKSGTWTTIRQQVSSWDKSDLIALIKDLFEADSGNRDFILARCKAGEDTTEVLERYRGKIVEQFYPARGFGKLKLGEARKAIRDYRKATGSLPGTVELMMTFVENGVKFTHDFGDIDERFYNSVESMLDELAALFRGAAKAIYPQFQGRLARLEKLTDGIGWGFHDFIGEVVGELEEDLSRR